jgi:hypothetical protein
MLGRLVILGALILGVLWFLHWFRRTPPQRVAKSLRRAALYGAIGLVVVLVATGRLNPLFAALAAAIPFVIRGVNLLRMLPAIQQVLRMLGIQGIPGVSSGGNPGSSGGTSTINTRFLEMSLDHDSGRMDGLVLEGEYRGRRLSEIDLDQLMELLAVCRAHDPRSAALLEAYLDRVHGERWREGAETGGQGGFSSETRMTREEAFSILGLDEGATSDEIREAHRRLMQKFHPDRGGSDYLAAKINEAKRQLLRG